MNTTKITLYPYDSEEILRCLSLHCSDGDKNKTTYNLYKRRVRFINRVVRANNRINNTKYPKTKTVGYTKWCKLFK